MNINPANTVKKRRKKKVSIQTSKHWEAVSSAIRFEILSFLVACGPCSVAELARQMGTRADRLYHHVKKLVSAEIVEEVGHRRVGKQTESVYDLVAEKLEFDINVDSERFMKLLKSIHRRSERTFQNALDHGLVNFTDKKRNSYICGDTSWLTREERLRVNTHLEAIFDIFAKGRKDRNGELFSLTLNLSPIHRTGTTED